jgi:hypothetical protein
VWGCDASDPTFCVVFAVMGQDLKFILQLILLGKMKIVIFLVADKKKSTALDSPKLMTNLISTKTHNVTIEGNRITNCCFFL